VEGAKNISSTFKKWLNSVWKKDGGSPQDSTLTYSEMHGGLENAFDPDEFINQEQRERKVKHINNLETRAREAGL
jgi:hypothetical protein